MSKFGLVPGTMIELILTAGWLRYVAPLAFILIFLASYKSVKDARSFSKYRYPGVVPGALPFLGNAHQIPKNKQAAFFTDLAKTHGEMYVQFNCSCTPVEVDKCMIG